MAFDLTIHYARKQDDSDQLAHFSEKFYFPERNGRKSIYLCGNSLGLQPKSAREFLNVELDSWKNNGVEGHFEGLNPWISYHKTTKKTLCKLVGAKEMEVVSMNNLTTNLHLMLASFYQPKGKRTKILIEGGAFPSDHYAAESAIERIGLDPKEHLEVLSPRNGSTICTHEILDKINSLGDTLALVLWPGVQYYTGQFFNLKMISQSAHEVGAFAGYDLAHAIGNLPLNLHAENVDFATWCTYKYLNSGPGAVSGVFIHEKHCSNPDFPKLKGWWGHDQSTRFNMDNHFRSAPGADAWMLSNMNILSMAAHRAALEIFEDAGIENLRKKSLQLTTYLETLLTSEDLIKERIKIITPSNPDERGCQLSVFLLRDGKEVFDQLIEKGVILDWREPNVIRVAPTPLYNSFVDVWQFYSILRGIFAHS